MYLLSSTDTIHPQVPQVNMYSATQCMTGQKINELKAAWLCAQHGACFIDGDGTHVVLNMFHLNQWGSACVSTFSLHSFEIHRLLTMSFHLALRQPDSHGSTPRQTSLRMVRQSSYSGSKNCPNVWPFFKYLFITQC